MAAPFFRKLLDKLPHGGMFDRVYRFVMFVYAHRRTPRRHSALFNDYLYFLKADGELYDIVRQMTSDKVMVKAYVRSLSGDIATVETVAVISDLADLRNRRFQCPVVVKPAHGSGSVVFVRDPQGEIAEHDLSKLAAALDSSPYTSAREPNYRYLRPRLICEKMLPEGEQVKDYKVFCFKGEPRVIQVDSERHTAHRRNLYDASWSRLPIEYNFPLGEWEARPAGLDEMLEISRLVCREFEFVRVDFLVSQGKPFVAEITHCPENAHGRFASIEQERQFSKLLFG